MANIILITHWLGGDVIPFIKLGRMLRKNGNEVTLLTHNYYRKLAAEQGLPFAAIDTLEEYQDMLKDFELFADPVGHKEQTIEFHEKHHGKERLLREVKLISELIKDDTILFFRHRSSISGLLAAEKYHLPAVSVFLAPNYAAHLEFHEQLFGSAIKEQINRARTELQLEQIGSWSEWMCSPKAILGFWPEWYAPEISEIIKELRPVGFVQGELLSLEELPLDLRKFLALYPKPVLISGGTSKYISGSFYQAAVDACIEAELPAILICPDEKLIPSPLPGNILQVDFVPMIKVMKEAGAILHHGGINTSAEALAEGLPQVILPYLADRPDNGQRLQNAGIAITIPYMNWDKKTIGEALREIVTPGYREIYHQRIDKYRNNAFESNLNDLIHSILLKKEDFLIQGEETQLLAQCRKVNSPTHTTDELWKRINEIPESKKQQLLKLLKAGR